MYWIGDGSYPLLLFLSFAAGLWLVNGRIVGLLQRGLGVLLLVACTSTAAELLSQPGTHTLSIGAGGVAGAGLAHLLLGAFSKVGTALVLVYSVVVGLLFTAEGWVLRIPQAVGKVRSASGTAATVTRQAISGMISTPVVSGAREIAASALRSDDVTDDENEASIPRINRHRAKPVPQEQEAGAESSPRPPAGKQPADGQDEPPDKTDDKQPARHDPARKDASAAKPVEPVVRVPKPVVQEPPAVPYPTPVENWSFPPLNLLINPEIGFTAQQESIVRAKAKMLEQTLSEFRLDARVVEIDTGPVITMFEIQIGAGIKVSQVASLANDIARALKAPAVRVVAPIPGKNTIGIEVPNVDKEKVRLKELITLAAPKAQKMALPLFLGKDASGAALLADLAAMPHMLIAGTTGSGKSVCINSLVASILMTKKPDEVKLILVDPKMVEMSQFKDVPHLMSPIITDMARAEQILDWAVTKMEERYELLAEARVRNITTYNKLGADEIEKRFRPATEEERVKIPVKLPYIVIIIDELADLMMTSAKEVEHHLARLAQKSRAVGIHIIVATQRPEAKVVTGLIKSNLPCRCAFRVASRMDSRIVLDQNGAEVLMGQGDMLFLPPGSAKLVRAQGTLLDDDELLRIIDFLADQGRPEFHPQLMRLKAPGLEGDGERDPMFDQAVRVVLESKRGSVSLLQRRLSVGYSRASRLIEQMAEAGIVGDFKGSQAREVAMTLEEWEALKASVERDVAQGYAADEDDEKEQNQAASTDTVATAPADDAGGDDDATKDQAPFDNQWEDIDDGDYEDEDEVEEVGEENEEDDEDERNEYA